MKIYVPLDFSKKVFKEGISDSDLRSAIQRAEKGLVDAQIGAALIKPRVPRQGQGRSGGFRTIVAYRRGDLAVFLFMFAKNSKANLTKAETEAFRALSDGLSGLSDEALMRLAFERGWRQIDDEQPEEDVPK